MRRFQRKKKPSHTGTKESEPFFNPIQAKILVGKSNDKYEQEADAMADSVVNKQHTNPGISSGGNAVQQKPLAEQITPLVQKAEEEEAQTKIQRQEEEEAQTKLQLQEEEEAQTKIQRQEEEEAAQPKLQRMEEEEAQTKLQRQEEEEAVQSKTQTQTQTPKVSQKTEATIKQKQGLGNAMDSKTLHSMESAFGADFSHINIHTDATAIALCKELGAQAFTYGNDIYFNEGKYNPEFQANKHLLAHELTHTIQQQGIRAQKIHKKRDYGSGTPPDTDYRVVADKEKPRVNRAISILKKIVDNPTKYKNCHEFFKQNNPGNTSLAVLFDRLNIWFDNDDTVYGSSHPPNQIAFSSETWRWGEWTIAGVFVHEMMHLAGQHNEATDDTAITKCKLPDIAKK